MVGGDTYSLIDEMTKKAFCQEKKGLSEISLGDGMWDGHK